MAKYKVDITGINTSSLQVLSNEEQIELFKKFQDGDMSAKEKLVNGNLKLVLSILKKYNNRYDNMDDLFQVGVIGLIKAIDNFDLSYNLKLSTYACPLILGEVKRLIRTNNSVRVARSIRDLAFQILKFKDEYSILYGIEPTNEVIAKELGIEEYEIKSALESLYEPVSIYEPIYNDGGDTIYLLDQIADLKDKNTDKDMLLAMNQALSKLKEREKNILIDRYIIGKTQNEIAEELNVSQAQISRIEKSAINSMKKLLD